MSEPTLSVIAGCNGSGKSTFSGHLVPSPQLPFDYDRCYLEFYASLLDSDIRGEMAHNLAFKELIAQVNRATELKHNFSYETNFNATPLHWPKIFKKHGYRLHLIYLCLKSVTDANERVSVRVANGGHFVSEAEIITRYYDGFTNLNTYFGYFDLIDIFETSAHSNTPQHLLSIEAGEIIITSELPQYLHELIPAIIG